MCVIINVFFLQIFRTECKFEKLFLGKKSKNHHILRGKNHKLPYWDNEFLLVAKTREDLKKNILYYLPFYQIWFLPLVDDHQSTYSKNGENNKMVVIKIYSNH
jgi:hypothetical protein